ncbi:hypothetical protein TL16_g08304 [Triparma laevis f. inornata]|uniref:Tetratricopeptide repeat protein n=1 Tax=Triparma laevis f. inornata TaxID=1714386 RepID=A0A9W7AXL4_9STRA|nr:hypothetical protein TL16_g08304 [Triparma laevis f. inornata]
MCRDCTEKLMKQGDPCPFCRKEIEGFDLGKRSSSIGAAGLWHMSLRNLSELASGEGFNDYFRNMFNGNEATYLRWKKFFDVLGIEEGKGGGGLIETQVLKITNSEDLMKLRALAQLCSKEFFDDKSLLVVAWRRIMEVLDMEEKRDKKGEKEEGGTTKLEMLDGCFALGQACGWVGDFEDARRYYKRAKEGYEEQLGRDSEKAIEVARSLIASATMSRREKIEKYRDLLKRMERALGEENVVTLDTLNALGNRPRENGEYDEAKEVYERCLAGRMAVLGGGHKDKLGTLQNLGVVYSKLENYEKALECYERALTGKEKLLGKAHPETLMAVECIAIVYNVGLKEYEKAFEMYTKALKGYE